MEPADAPGLAKLRTLVYPHHPEAYYADWHDSVWSWLETHPLSEDMERWVVAAGDEVVGHLAAVPQYYRVNGERAVAHTPADYQVLPQYGFQALSLMRKFFRTVENCVACDMVSAVITVETRMGAVIAGDLQYRAKLLDVSRLPSPSLDDARALLGRDGEGPAEPPRPEGADEPQPARDRRDFGRRFRRERPEGGDGRDVRSLLRPALRRGRRRHTVPGGEGRGVLALALRPGFPAAPRHRPRRQGRRDAAGLRRAAGDARGDGRVHPGPHDHPGQARRRAHLAARGRAAFPAGGGPDPALPLPRRADRAPVRGPVEAGVLPPRQQAQHPARQVRGPRSARGGERHRQLVVLRRRRRIDLLGQVITRRHDNMATQFDVAPEIREWLKQNVTGGREVADDEPLIENGVLTSLQTVELVMFLEERFGIVIEDEEFDEENFGSIEAISDLVAS